MHRVLKQPSQRCLGERNRIMSYLRLMVSRWRAGFCVVTMISLLSATTNAQKLTPAKAKDNTYMPVLVQESFEEIYQKDTGEKDGVMEAQKSLLDKRYDLRDNPSDVQMSGKRKAVQQGVRVKLQSGTSWDRLSNMSPEQIKRQNMFPMGFRPLPHVKHPTGGMVFPKQEIDEIKKQEVRDLQRFDVDFDLPDHFTPEFPPPMFLTSRPDLGDVSQGQVLTIKNYYKLLYGKVTPVQMEGMRLLLTPNPQQQFNQTEDRKVHDPTFGVTCFDCHTNGHTNGTF